MTEIPENHDQLMLLALALAVGLLIGVERGWREREAPDGERIAGLRTFGLLGLMGGVTGLLSTKLGAAFLGLVFVAVAIVLVVAYAMSLRTNKDVGITSLIAGLLTFALGSAVVIGYAKASLAAAVVVATLLSFKPVLHRWLRSLESQELYAGLKLLLISVVLLPVLPNRGFGPWDALNPYQIWWMVVLIAAISFVGYFAMKIAGPGKGIPFTGLFAGLASSTALTLHFSRLGARHDDLARLLAAGILIACGTMLPRMVLIAGLIHPPLVTPLVQPALVMGALILMPGLWFWYRSGHHTNGGSGGTMQNPLELTFALRFGLLLAVIMLLGRALQQLMGEAGVYILAAASGITDVDAINLSLSRMTQAGELMERVAVIGIVIAAGVNTVVKGLLATVIGGKRLGLLVGVPLGLAALAGLIVVVLTV